MVADRGHWAWMFSLGVCITRRRPGNTWTTWEISRPGRAPVNEV